MGLQDYVKLMDEFYDIYGNGLKSAEVPAELKGRFEFIDGKGKMSHGIRLHEAVESKPASKPLKPLEPEKPNPWKEGLRGFQGWGN